MPEYTDEMWLKDFNKKVPPVLDRYLKEMVEKCAIRDNRKASRQEIENLIRLIKVVIKPVVVQADESYGMIYAGYNDGHMARTLEPYVQEFLPYGPMFVYALLGYESLSRFGFTASIAVHISYIGARMLHDHSPGSYDIIESIMNELDRTTLEYIRKLEGFTSPDRVLQRRRYDLIGVLYRMAMPTHDGWPNKRLDVSKWAKKYLESLYERASYDLGFQFDIGAYLNKLGGGISQ